MALEINHLRNITPDHLLVKDGTPFIELDLTSGYVDIGITTEPIDGGRPHQGKIRYELSHRIDASGIYDWINREMYFDFEELMTIGDKVSDLGLSLVRICKHYVPQLSFLAGYWTAQKWLNRPESCLDEYNITAETSYFDLTRIADTIVEEARSVYAILDVADVQAFLDRYQEQMKPVVQAIDMRALEHMPAEALLHRHNPAYLSIDLKEGVITAQIGEKQGGYVRNFMLNPQVDAAELKRFCETTLDGVLKVLFDGLVKNYDGQEMGVYLSRDAEGACEDVARLCYDAVPLLGEYAGFWDAHDWLEKGIDLPDIPPALGEEEATELASDIVGLARLHHAHLDEEEVAVALLEKAEECSNEIARNK